MKSFVVRFSIILVLSVTFSCAPRGTAKIPSSEVIDLLKFETSSYISFIDKGNRMINNDSLSAISKENFDQALSAFRVLPIKESLYIEDTALSNRVNEEVKFLMSTAIKSRYTKLSISPLIDSILESRGYRFGMLNLTAGFTRKKGNYGNQILKSIGIGVLSMGRINQTPIKCSSRVFTMIVDSKLNNIAFYKASYYQDQEPLDKIVVTKQIQRLFHGYYWKLKPVDKSKAVKNSV